MARNQTNNRKQKREPVPPKLLAYHVAERGESKFWTRIGAAWDHKDGEGWTIQLDLVPVGDGRIVLRPPRDDSEDAADDADTEGDSAADGDEAEQAAA